MLEKLVISAATTIQKKGDYTAYEMVIAPALQYRSGHLWFLGILQLKEQLRNRTFSTNEGILLACDQIFSRILATEFVKTFWKWIQRWEQCIEVDGRYFEK